MACPGTPTRADGPSLLSAAPRRLPNPLRPKPTPPDGPGLGAPRLPSAPRCPTTLPGPKLAIPCLPTTQLGPLGPCRPDYPIRVPSIPCRLRLPTAARTGHSPPGPSPADFPPLTCSAVRHVHAARPRPTALVASFLASSRLVTATAPANPILASPLQGSPRHSRPTTHSTPHPSSPRLPVPGQTPSGHSD